MRSESYVIDCATGNVLEGPPSRLLWLLDDGHEAYRDSSGEWQVSDNAEWDRDVGFDVRTVRVVTKREIVRGLVAFVCSLAEDAIERSAFRRKAEKDLAAARDQLREFYEENNGRGWSREVLLTAKVLRNNVERLQAAAGVEVDP